MSDALESFFGGVKTEADLDRFVHEKQEEGLHLEFKEKHDRSNGEVDDGDRYHFSRAVSAFANAAGGVLIFGVETKKSQDSPDRACALKPITGADQFRVRLQDSILNTTHRPVDGVRVEVVPGRPGEGYVKCLIPASDMMPHRAMLAKREYWCRTSSGHVRKMEHYELEDFFGRRLRPVLRLQVELRPRPGPEPLEDVYFYFLNEGRGVARHAGMLFEFTDADTQVTVAHGVHMAKPARGNIGRPVVVYYDNAGVVHPNGLFAPLGGVTIKRPKNQGAPLSADARWYAENMSTRREEIYVRPGIPRIFNGNPL
jgi:hypothetical protein